MLCLWMNQLPKRFIREIRFAAIHSRVVTYFVFSVEQEKLAVIKVIKVLSRRFEMCVEYSLRTESDSLSTLICRKWERLV